MLTGLPASIAEDDPLPPEDRVAWQSGVEIDVGAVYRAERPGLLRMLRRRVMVDHAADLVQHAFVRFIGLEPDKRAGIASPRAYLRQAAANLSVDEARRAACRVSHAHVSTDDVELHAPDQLAALEARDLLNRLDAALLRLKPRTREIFLAHRLDGYSYVEIAARTGLSVKGVEKHMSRAIAHIDRLFSAR